jgi:hypothetical protein
MPELLLVWFILWCVTKLPISEPARTICILVGLVLGILALFGRRLVVGLG